MFVTTEARAQARELARRVQLGLESIESARRLISIAPAELRVLQKILTVDRVRATVEFRKEILREFEKLIERRAA